MELVLPCLWWFDAIAWHTALLLYLVHRLEMPEYHGSVRKPLQETLTRLSQTGDYGDKKT